ncbi:hypothetical protein QBC39DRAFT_329390 [Podospora conica]|nr:hypothetical protein QBC39DRAFT_329390 [Schizothecium conicum]
MDHRDNSGGSATPASANNHQVSPSSAVALASDSPFAPADTPAADTSLAALTTPAADNTLAALTTPAASTVLAAAFASSAVAVRLEKQGNRLEKQGKDLRRDHAALKGVVDKKTSKHETEKVAAQVNKVSEEVEDLRKKMEGARMGEDEDGEAGWLVPADVLAHIDGLVQANRALESRVQALETKVEVLEGRVVAERRARRALAAEVETLDRGHTNMINVVRDLQAQINQLHQTAGAGMLHN